LGVSQELVIHMTKNPYPEIITSLPQADIPLSGVQGWIAQGKEFQIIFFDIEPTGTLPPHRHSGQFGVVIEGEMSLTAEFHSHFRALDFFAEPERYKAKEDYEE
jgi:hypothetical protein